MTDDPKNAPEQIIPKDTVVELGAASLAKLNDLAQTTIASPQEIAAVATLGEQLGIDSESAEFTKTVLALAEATPLTIDEAVRALIAALGFEEEDVAGIEIRAGGIIRVLETDHGGRGFRFEKLKRKVIAQ
ncbi:MAG: hypothetical protein K0S65_2667 [Labilithrix sp.]|jgi:hypothetical protein|nr:hypothetical protein [Labilithrix sp.]